jgi:hypothetical protein
MYSPNFFFSHTVRCLLSQYLPLVSVFRGTLMQCDAYSVIKKRRHTKPFLVWSTGTDSKPPKRFGNIRAKLFYENYSIFSEKGFAQIFPNHFGGFGQRTQKGLVQRLFFKRVLSQYLRLVSVFRGTLTETVVHEVWGDRALALLRPTMTRHDRRLRAQC